MNKVLQHSKYGLALLALFITIGCNSSKKASKEAPPVEDVKSQSGDNHRLIVSFFSPGNGIDHKAKKKFIEFLSASYPKVKYESNRWGKEGEITLCFLLSELKEKDEVIFIKESKEVLASCNRVHIYENAPCGNKK